MAKQDGIIPLKGAIDKIAFVKRKSGGYGAQKKSVIDRKRLESDPGFLNTRQNGAEFGRAGKAGKLIRRALTKVMLHTADKIVTGRLVKVTMKVLKSDPIHGRGLRTVPDGNIKLLEGFEFNAGAPFDQKFQSDFTATIDRATGSLGISIPAFIPIHVVKAPPGTTHFRLISSGVEIDFANATAVKSVKTSDYIAWENVVTPVIELNNTVTAASIHPIILVLGIEFYQDVNGEKNPIQDKSFNSLVIVRAVKV